MKRQLQIGDTVKCMGIVATIKEITFQEPWEWREAWYLEFTDTNGVYRSWKQNCDGGEAFDESGNPIPDHATHRIHFTDECGTGTIECMSQDEFSEAYRNLRENPDVDDMWVEYYNMTEGYWEA